MKVESADVKVVGRGIEQSVEFQVANSAKMMEMLSSALYSNKIKAVIRELMTNACDAHKEAGTYGKKQPIMVLPTNYDRKFSIRDFGTGLSLENLGELYRTYGASTKTTSNDYNGCMGIGSKAPFAYTSAFTVESFYNGKKYTCIMTKNRQNIPSINILPGEDTKEENGLRVSFTVDAGDTYRFLQEAQRVMRPFPTEFVPTCTHRDWKDDRSYPDMLLKGNNWTLCSRTPGGYNECIARMGYVEYPIDMQQFYDEVKENTEIKYGRNSSELFGSRYGRSYDNSGVENKYTRLLNCRSLILDFEIGEVEMDISREGLQYHDKTIALIKQRLDSVLAEVKKNIEEQVKSAKNIWEAERAYSKSTIVTNTVRMTDLKPEWNGLELGSPGINLRNIEDKYNIYDCSLSYGGQLQKYPAHSMNRRNFYHIVFADLKTGNFARTKEAMKTDKLSWKKFEKEGATQYGTEVLIVQPKDDKTTIDDFVKETKWPFDHTLSSTLPKPPKSASNKKHSAKVFKLSDQRGSVVASSWWKTIDVDMDKGGYYIVIDRFEYAAKSPSYLYNYIEKCKKLGIIVPSFIAVKVAKKEEFEKNAKWKPLDDGIAEAVSKWLKSSNALAKYYNHIAFGDIGSTHMSQVDELKEIFDGITPPAEVEVVFKKFDELYASSKANDAQDVIDFLKVSQRIGFNIEIDTKKTEEAKKAFPDLVKQMYNKYPDLPIYMLAHSEPYSVRDYNVPSKAEIARRCRSYVSSI